MHETAISHFCLEHPAPGQPLPAGQQRLRGWLAAKPGRHFVDLRVRAPDGIHLAEYGHPRSDLARFFGSPAPCLLAGFELALELTSGETRLEFEACDLAGKWSRVAAATVTAIPAVDQPAATPPVASLCAHEFTRALQQLLRRLRLEPARPLAELAAGVAAATPWPCTLRHPHRPFHGHLDEPAAVAPAGFGRLNVLGWLFHETEPIRRVFATFDLQAWQVLRHGGPFAGVKSKHPEFARADDCALEGLVDVPAQLSQPRCLRVYAELEDGSWHLAHVQRSWTIDREQEKLPFAPYSFWIFWRARRALRTAYATAGVPVESGAESRRQTWRTWRDYRFRAPRRLPPVKPPYAPVLPTAAPGRLGRVLLATHNLSLEGAPLFLWEYARYLVTQAGAKLTVISAQEGPLRARFEALGATVRVLDTSRLSAAISARALRRELRRLGAQLDLAGIELVVANTMACFWAVHAAHAAGRPSLLYIHESTTPAAFFHGRLAAAVLPVVEAAFAQATRVSFLTEATRRYYDDLAIRPNYCINPGWIDLHAIDAFRTAHARAELRAEFGVASGELLVANVGSVCERKGQTVFARAVDLLWRLDPALAGRTHFLMVGGRDTSYDRDLADFLRELNHPRLKVLPETPDVYACYGAADLFVCTSYEESFPRVILEAMGFALPIVSTNVHGIPEIVRDGQEAALLPPGDTQALAEAMCRVLLNPALAGGFSARARRRVETAFTLEHLLPRHHALACALAAGQV
jgi:glycosyltransferase involved in cell wall biosynthesis